MNRGGRGERGGGAERTLGGLIGAAERHINHVSGQIVDSAMRVHSALGPGLLESACQTCLIHELRKRGLAVRSQVSLPIMYDGMRLDAGYRMDLLVEELVIAEIKALANLLPVHEAQILSYLRLSGRKVGLLINFHEVRLKDGIRRYVNDL